MCESLLIDVFYYLEKLGVDYIVFDFYIKENKIEC